MPAGTKVTVSATGVTVSDGQKDAALGSVSYSTTIAPPLSGNCNLSSLTVANANITPAFSPSVTSYSASVPFQVSSLQLEPQAEHAGAKVSVSNNKLAAAATTTVKITVTAENGATKTYSIKVTRAQDPNYIKSSNAALKGLQVEGYALSPGFGAEQLQYYVWLPYEAATAKLTAETADTKASVQIDPIPELAPGKGTAVAVTVTAEDGTQQVYTVTLIRAPEDPENFLNPVPETTDPITEPTEPPTTELTAEPTQPSTSESSKDGSNNGVLVLVITGLLCAAAGGGITALVLILLRRKKRPSDI